MDDFLFGLLEVTLCASAVIAALLLLGKELDRRFVPQWRYWAWLVLALRLAIPFNVTLPQAPVVLEFPRAEVRYERQIDPEPGLPQVSLRAPSAPLPAVDPRPASEDLEEHGKGDPRCVVSVGVSLDIPLSRVLFALWAGGAGFSLLAPLLSYARFQRRAGRWSRPVGTYRGLPVAECDLIATPLLMGLLRPVILVPPGGGENEFALLHEYTHAKRHDLWYKLLLVWVSALYWFDPLVWALRRGAGRDLEISCDAQVLRGRDDRYRRAYGQALLSNLSAGRKPGSSLTSAFSGSKRSLRRRFASLMETAPRRPGRTALALLCAVSLLGGTLVACGQEGEKTPLLEGAEPAVDGSALADGTYRFALYGLPGIMPEDLSAQPERLLVREMDGYDGDRGYYYYYHYGLPGRAEPSAGAPALYQISAAGDAVYQGFQNSLWMTVMLSSQTPPWMALEVEMRGGQAAAVSRAEDCVARRRELVVVTGFEPEADVGPRLWYQSAEEGAEGLRLLGRGVTLVKENTLLADQSGKGTATDPETFFQGLLGQAVELSWDNHLLVSCVPLPDLTEESRLLYSAGGSYDPEGHSYTFTPLEVDREEGTWRDAGAEPVTLLVADSISLPPVHLPMLHEGEELPNVPPEGERYVQWVLESESVHTSAGDTLLELEVRSGIICAARWLAAFQPAG